MKLTAWLILMSACVLCGTSARGSDDGLIARYDFDEGRGDLARDVAANAPDGRIHGARHVQAGRGFCLEFDGNDDYVDCGELDTSRMTAITLIAWARPSAVPVGEVGIIGRGVDSLDQSFGLTFFENSACYFYLARGANNCLTTIEPQMWHHLAATFDGSEIQLYVNGRPRAGRLLAPSTMVPNLGRLLIGRNGRFYFKGLIDNVRIYDRALPVQTIRAAYEAELDQVVRPLKLQEPVEPREIHRGDFAVIADRRDRVIEIALGNERYRIASEFDFISDQITRRRTVSVRGHRIQVEDRLANQGHDPVGVLLNHAVAGANIFRETLLGGGEVTTVSSIAENPTLFLSQRASSIGILAEDNIFRLQLEARAAGDVARFGVRHFALAGGATHTFRWTIYPFTRRADQFDLINLIRRDWETNYRIDGPFDWLEVDHPRTIALLSDREKLKDHLARRPLRLVALLPFLSYHAGAPLSRQQYKDLMQSARRALREVAPDIRCLGSIENNIISYERSKLSGGVLFEDVCRNSGAYPLALSQAQTSILREQIPWRDSLVINRDGRALVEDCMPTSFVHPMVYAAPGNHHAAYLMEQAKFLIETVGLDGIYVDHFNMAFEPQQRYDHSKWDQTSVEIDPQTRRITARYTDAALVGIKPRESLSRYVLDAGKTMVVNTPSVANEARLLPVLHLEEVGANVDLRAFDPGQEPPLVPHLARLQLGSPVAIGVPSSNRAQPHVQDAQEVARTVITYLRHGLLYYHNQTLIPESGVGSGEYGAINHMFPITPVSLHKGWIEGKQRSIACVSTDLLFPACPSPPEILLFDTVGLPVAHTMRPIKVDRGWKVQVRLKDWAEIAVVVPQHGVVKP